MHRASLFSITFVYSKQLASLKTTGTFRGSVGGCHPEMKHRVHLTSSFAFFPMHWISFTENKSKHEKKKKKMESHKWFHWAMEIVKGDACAVQRANWVECSIWCGMPCSWDIWSEEDISYLRIGLWKDSTDPFGWGLIRSLWIGVIL